MTVLRSVSEQTRFEMDPVKGSRFVGTVAPARTEEEALAVVSALRAEWPGANHHCWAWRLQDGQETGETISLEVAKSIADEIGLAAPF